jgi:hypothetical protein
MPFPEEKMSPSPDEETLKGKLTCKREESQEDAEHKQRHVEFIMDFIIAVRFFRLFPKKNSIMLQKKICCVPGGIQDR